MNEPTSWLYVAGADTSLYVSTVDDTVKLDLSTGTRDPSFATDGYVGAVIDDRLVIHDWPETISLDP